MNKPIKGTPVYSDLLSHTINVCVDTPADHKHITLMLFDAEEMRLDNPKPEYIGTLVMDADKLDWPIDNAHIGSVIADISAENPLAEFYLVCDDRGEDAFKCIPISGPLFLEHNVIQPIRTYKDDEGNYKHSYDLINVEVARRLTPEFFASVALKSSHTEAIKQSMDAPTSAMPVDPEKVSVTARNEVNSDDLPNIKPGEPNR